MKSFITLIITYFLFVSCAKERVDTPVAATSHRPHSGYVQRCGTIQHSQIMPYQNYPPYYYKLWVQFAGVKEEIRYGSYYSQPINGSTFCYWQPVP